LASGQLWPLLCQLAIDGPPHLIGHPFSDGGRRPSHFWWQRGKLHFTLSFTSSLAIWPPKLDIGAHWTGR
jgi:hypothetical protein